ncbi:MAG: undecaprenyldiphospho-muramoylpentapeptide beta-N-acetylglucosaminyltransferase [Magnetococcales bacterium]|nr:undecaprenyldiphospho-muramoylpentapeptide beta-N-acetylglucosaminyltransferase [Magnetococcales bacterium]
MAVDKPGLLIAGGGTGGHLFPAIAVAEAWEAETGGEVLFVGTPWGLESRLLPQQGRRLATLRVGRLKGSGTVVRIKTLLGLPRALLEAMGIVRSFRPRAVLGVGGYASAPAVAAARLLGVPALLHEQNARPGLANRWLSRLVREVLISFPEAAAGFPGRTTTLTGNPVRRGLDRPAAAEPPGAERPLSILVFGGSQGARIFSEIVPPAVALVAATQPGAVRLRQQAVEADRPQLESFYRHKGIPAEVLPFIHDMERAYREADLVICRAGATSVAELAAMGKPALLIPYPFAADDHQTANAAALVAAGGGWMRRQEELDERWLADFLGDRLADRAGLLRAGENARTLGHPDAARRVVARILALSGSGR